MDQNRCLGKEFFGSEIFSPEYACTLCENAVYNAYNLAVTNAEPVYVSSASSAHNSRYLSISYVNRVHCSNCLSLLFFRNAAECYTICTGQHAGGSAVLVLDCYEQT